MCGAHSGTEGGLTVPSHLRSCASGSTALRLSLSPLRLTWAVITGRELCVRPAACLPATVRGLVECSFNSRSLVSPDDSGHLLLVFCTQVALVPWAEPVTLREGRKPPLRPQPTDCTWGSFLDGGPRRGRHCGNFRFQVHNDQILSRSLHLDLLSDLQAGGAGEALLPLSLRPPQVLRVKRGLSSGRHCDRRRAQPRCRSSRC